MGDKGILMEDAGEGMTQCSDHPYRNNPGGICAFCLQEKLGKLVSSSNGSTPFLSLPPPISSSSSPSFRSDYGIVPSTSTVAKKPSKLPYLSKVSATSPSTSSNNVTLLKRSKSVAPRPMGAIPDSPRKKSFWSFLYLSSRTDNNAIAADLKQQDQDQEQAVSESPGDSHASSSSFGRKVARSRSVGCGSRSFSGDFLERISTGFGDCTLRRVESHRESNKLHHHHDTDEQRIKERMKCGGIFGAFGMISSSSLLAAATAAAADEGNFDKSNGRSGASTAMVRGRGGRSKSWGWAFASPMRAFRPSTSSSKAYASATSTIAGGGGKMSNGEWKGKEEG